MLMERGAHLIIPPFLKGQQKFDLKQEATGRMIANARIPVEQFNERFKNWEFVGNRIVPHYYKPLISQALYVACCLANFTEMLVKSYW